MPITMAATNIAPIIVSIVPVHRAEAGGDGCG